MSKVQSWGRLSSFDHNIFNFHTIDNVRGELAGYVPGIAYGMGRSYGDAALNSGGNIWLASGLNHLISFDVSSGILHCEAGVSLQDIQRAMVPEGWMLPVTPGTQMITIGGAIANDVHGKNHHEAGSFGDHVISLKLLRTNGEIIECSHIEKSEWFYATLGGIGLTGLIIEAKLRLRAVPGAWIQSETIPYYSLNDFFELASSSERDWEHTVSWIDCANGLSAKGLFIRGNIAEVQLGYEPEYKNKNFPFTPPVSLINSLSLSLFNYAYFHSGRVKKRQQVVHYENFLYPLDSLHGWNKMYGPSGFYQYQSVIPFALASEATQEMLKIIKKSGEGSFLAVLKTFGNRQSGGMLSFPQPGVTLALDFPNRGEKTLKLFHELDQIVYEAKGRLYLAKDARMPRALFESGYPGIQEFLKYRDPGISSEMSRRLLGG
ncbi:FAD-binding oxidoreductase [Acinetobacter chinensis]|uniref:FAD-binding oxidoreductase n=1 Tax=Acinetobacter chinensis TaxID=2004650 RepID=A0ABU3WG81_9GAMM|nr:FAD-binding oxidoreductase [Acinetobacter chinensis]MDV2469327.1 FAD-binding oxidoreductase [Acinetobacter chinensis]